MRKYLPNKPSRTVSAEEIAVLLMVFFFLFGCIIIPEPPVPVELTTFSNLQPTETLTFNSPGDHDTFQLNMSQYTTVGNSSEPTRGGGVVQNFEMDICPEELGGSNVSNLTLYWPSGGSTRFWNDTLSDCQTVYLDPIEFNKYLAVHQAYSLASMVPAMLSGGGASFQWGISQKNPKMHDVDEPIVYQFAILEPDLPPSLIEKILNGSGASLPAGFELFLSSRLDGIAYTCYDSDGVRTVASPTEKYQVRMSLPNLNLSSLISWLDIPNSTVLVNASIFNLPCPAYETPGRYRADVRRLLLHLDNYTGLVPSDYFSDDFNTTSLSGRWVIRAAGTQGANGWFVDNSASSTLDLYSEGNVSGSMFFYYRNYTVDESGGSIFLSADISTAGEPPVNLSLGLPEGAGFLGFMNEPVYPGAFTAEVAPHLRGGMFGFGSNASLVVCQNGTFAYLAPTSAGFHLYEINATNNTQTFYLDGAQVAQCTNEVSSDLYPFIASDPGTDIFRGNDSADWVNITTYSGGPGTWSQDWKDFDHFNSALNTSKWLMRNVSAVTETGHYIYNPSMSRIELYSSTQTTPPNSTAILMYYNDSFAAPTSNESGYYLSAKMYVDPDVKTSATGFAFMTDIVNPGSLSSVLPYNRGSMFYANDMLMAICPDFGSALMENMSGLITPGYHDFGYLANNDTAVFLFDNVPIANCSPQTEDVYVAFTSDPLTDMYEGNTSIDLVSLYEVQQKDQYTGNAWFDIGLLNYLGYLNGSVYSDAIIFDQDMDGSSKYGRLFDFEVGSDSPGTLDINRINVTYGSLISYGQNGSYPTSSIDDASNFSWYAINSHIYNSDVELNSYLYNSTVNNSKLVLSMVTCSNVSNSRMIYSSSVYDPSTFGLGGLIQVQGCSGVVQDSDMNFAIILAGNVKNSTLKTIPIMVLMDFEDAYVDNLTLYKGKMILNGTKAPGMFGGTVDLGSLLGGMLGGSSGLPISCTENGDFVMDSAADLRLANLPAGNIECRFVLYNANVTIQNLTFHNKFGGVRLSLNNATLIAQNMTEPINVTAFNDFADLELRNLDTNEFDFPVVLSSNEMHLETGMISINGSAFNLSGVTGDTDTYVVFHGIDSWDGKITYYENFTTNMSEAVANGVECPHTQCLSTSFNSGEQTLTVRVNGFSTYVVNYAGNDTSEPSEGGGHQFDLEVSTDCAGEPTTFTATYGAIKLDGTSIRVYGPDSHTSLYDAVSTDSNGEAEFTPSEPGTYYYSARQSGYLEQDGSFSIEECGASPAPLEQPQPAQPEQNNSPANTPSPAQPPGAQPPSGSHAGECGEYINGAWVSYECCEDSECGQTSYCIQHMCSAPKLPAQGGSTVSVTSTQERPPAQETPAPQKATSCCLGGICGDLLGICWFYWVAIILFFIVGAIVLNYLSRAPQELAEPAPKKPKK